MLRIDRTSEDDREILLAVELAAFEDDESIGRLVADLLDDPSAKPLLSLLAWRDGKAVGHILFSHAELITEGKPASISLLAPLAVHPDVQKQGIGGALIEEGAKRLTAEGVDLVFVLGHPGYYPRHGFRPAGLDRFKAPYPLEAKNSDAWMVRELKPGALEGTSGRLSVASSIDEEEYWRE